MQSITQVHNFSCCLNCHLQFQAPSGNPVVPQRFKPFSNGKERLFGYKKNPVCFQNSCWLCLIPAVPWEYWNASWRRRLLNNTASSSYQVQGVWGLSVLIPPRKWSDLFLHYTRKSTSGTELPALGGNNTAEQAGEVSGENHILRTFMVWDKSWYNMIICR